MDLMLTRTDFSQLGIFGKLSDANGKQLFATLEHSYANEDGFEAKIPEGSYTCVRGDHYLDGMLKPFSTFEVKGVPGHTGLLFHWGNYNRDSAGCILLGESRLGSRVTNSRAAFAQFMMLQAGEPSFQLSISQQQQQP